MALTAFEYRFKELLDITVMLCRSVTVTINTVD